MCSAAGAGYHCANKTYQNNNIYIRGYCNNTDRFNKIYTDTRDV